MTVKLMGTTGSESVETYVLITNVSLLVAELSSKVDKVKDDTDGALLMLEGRIHALENAYAKPITNELVMTQPKKAKS
jgi:hypothetical protein